MSRVEGGKCLMIGPLEPGDPTEVAGYTLSGRLGEGGMGSVYLSFTRGGQPVALKVIRREYAQRAEFLRRFSREVEAARRVQGTYTAAVVDSDTNGPLPWLASAYVPAPSLADAVDRHGPLPQRTVLLLTAGMAEALLSVHATGIVHRDLKPSNVLLAADGPRVIDFGIARAVDATALTGTDVRLGTPAFMSPEQVSGEPAGPPLDVFALGLTAYFAATGKHPFGEGNPQALLHRIVSREPDMTSCPDDLCPLIQSCLAKDPAKRPSLDEVIEECRRVAQTNGTPLVRSERRWLPAAVAEEVMQRASDPLVPPSPAAAYAPTALDGQRGGATPDPAAAYGSAATPPVGAGSAVAPVAGGDAYLPTQAAPGAAPAVGAGGATSRAAAALATSRRWASVTAAWYGRLSPRTRVIMWLLFAGLMVFGLGMGILEESRK